MKFHEADLSSGGPPARYTAQYPAWLDLMLSFWHLHQVIGHGGLLLHPTDVIIRRLITFGVEEKVENNDEKKTS